MKLYIGNATSQNFNLHYRLPETNRVLTRFIPYGEQVLISEDLSKPDIDAIVHQGGVYGMISVDQVDQRATVYRGLCYSVGKEISSSKIEKLLYANRDVLIDLGKELRKNAAIVENNRLLKNNQEMGLPNLRKTEMTVQEETGEMSEGFRADFDTPSLTPRQRRRAAKG
jgi:hypothetical protein